MSTHDPIRAALERLVNAVDPEDIDEPATGPLSTAYRAARAALAEPVGEGPPAVTTNALLHPAYEPGDGSADGAQLVDGEWWHPAMGCDSLQIVVDNARNILTRWGHPTTPPAPEPGEVGELVKWLRSRAGIPGSPDFPAVAAYLTRAAALLQQQAAPAPAVVPVAVSERLPGEGDRDAEGRCWLLSKVEIEWRLLNVANSGVPHLKYCFSHWLPAHAIPLPQAGEGEQPVSQLYKLPESGEVGELVAWLRELGAKRGGAFSVTTFCANLDRAATLLQQLSAAAPVAVPVVADGPWRPIPAPQSGLPWRTDGPAVPEGREPASVAPEARPPSPAAAALVAAFDNRYECCGPFDGNWQEVCLAAVLRHLAAAHGDPESFGAVRPGLLQRLAAELEGMD